MVFYLVIDGTKSGGLTRCQVLEMIESGEAKKSTMGWTQGLESWSPLGEIPEFDWAFDSPPPDESPAIEKQGNGKAKGGIYSNVAKGEEGKSDGDRPLPWMRLLARGIDLVLFFVIFQIGFAYLFPGVFLDVSNSFSAQMAKVAALSAMILIWCLVEAFLLSTWGYTLGKALFQVIVRDEAGEILTFKRALQRALLVWVKGLALMFVLITPIAMMIAHARLMIFGETTWDRDLRIRVTHGRPGQAQMAVAVAIYVAFAFIIYKAVELQLEENRKEEGKEGEGQPGGGGIERDNDPAPKSPRFPEDLT